MGPAADAVNTAIAIVRPSRRDLCITAIVTASGPGRDSMPRMPLVDTNNLKTIERLPGWHHSRPHTSEVPFEIDSGEEYLEDSH